MGAAGAVLGADPQDALLAGLVSFMTKDTPSVQHVLDLSVPHLREAAGLTAATVFELDSETGLLMATARSGPPGRRDQLTAGKVFRLAAGAKPLVSGDQMAVRLRIGGQTVGVLLLTGTDLGALRDDVLAPLALHFAATLQGLAAEFFMQIEWLPGARITEQQVAAFFLVLTRLSPLFILAPLFSSKMIPARVRTVVAVGLSVGLMPVVKHGPIDFQTREPVSPVLAAMPATRLAVELQVTQEYTGQQRHVCHLPPMWRQVMGFEPSGDGATVARVTAAGGAVVAVSNVGDDVFWTGHPLAQANLYAFGRLAWDPALEPPAVLDEWIDLTFGPDDLDDEGAATVRGDLHAIMDDSWRVYEMYTAPLGVGFMVRPGHHYGPDVDGYEYTPWGTYHFADRDGVGVDRTRATGTGFTGQYPHPWSEVYESLERCPDELLLFFHHVRYDHVLRAGSTVVQHIYDTHFEGVERVVEMTRRWAAVPPEEVGAALHARVTERLDEQLRCAREWRDQINTYFLRKSGIPDAHGRVIH